MLFLLVIYAVALTRVSSVPNKFLYEVIQDEFIIRLDEKVINTEEGEHNVISYIQQHFDVQLKKAFHFGDITLLHVVGDDSTLSLAKRVGGVKYVERNSIGSVQQECLEQPSPGTWGLNRVEQHEALPYR